MTKLEQLKLTLAARDAARNGAEWDGHNVKVRRLLYDLTPSLVDVAEAAQNLIDMKGRHNTEVAYKRLEDAVKELK